MSQTLERTLDTQALDIIFRAARSHNAWREEPVPDSTLKAIWDLMKWGPTSANCQPVRILFLKSRAAKERLKPALIPGNVEKTVTAPVCAIIGYDSEFYELLPRTFPHTDARTWFVGEKGPKSNAAPTAFRNGTLQGAYFIIAARAMGLDCGPMSGFSNEKVDAEFFPDGRIKSNFICAMGRGDPTAIFPRNPRLAFDEACEIL